MNYPDIGESTSEHGRTLIMEAVQENNTRMVRWLLDKSPLTKSDTEGFTLLHYAALKTHDEATEFLCLIENMAKFAKRKHP